MGLYKGESFTEDEYKNINAATGKPFGQAGEEAVQNKAQDWRNQGSPVPGTKQPDDIRSLGQQLMDWSNTPAGNATIGGLGLLAAGAYGLSKRKTTSEAAPKTEPYVAPSYDYETTAREVSQAKGLPQPSTPVAEPTPTPTPNAPTSPTVAPAATTPVATQQPAISGYGQQTLNAPTGAPSPIAPTSTTQPVDPVVQARIDAIKEDQRRKQEAHENEQRRRDEKHDKQLEKQVKSATPKTVTKEPVAPITSSSQIPSTEVAAAQASIPANISATDDVSKKDLALVENLEKGKAVSKAKEAGANKPVIPPQRVDFQKTLGAPTLTTGSGMPAYEGQGGESAKMKKEFKSIADVPKGYVFVPEGQLMDITRNAVGQETFTSKLKEFGGYPLTQGQAYEQSRNINKSLGRPSYIEAKAAGIEPEPTKSITKSVGGSKLVKVAGVGGALISLANVANAKEAAQAVGEMLLPMGATPSTLAPGTLYTPAQQREFSEQLARQQAAERQKLGSPYRSVPPPI